jgi:hypothetical protein
MSVHHFFSLLLVRLSEQFQNYFIGTYYFGQLSKGEKESETFSDLTVDFTCLGGDTDSFSPQRVAKF